MGVCVHVEHGALGLPRQNFGSDKYFTFGVVHPENAEFKAH